MKIPNKKNEITLMVMPGANAKKTSIQLLQKITLKHAPVCYVNNIMDFQRIHDFMAEKKINHEHVLCISPVATKSNEADNCISIGSPRDLTKLSITIKSALKTKKFKSFLFDSISAMLVHNKTDTSVKFLHDLITELRESDLLSVLTVQKGSSPELLADLQMFVDTTITA